MTDTLVEKWLDGGCSSWGVPEQQIRKLLAQASLLDEAVAKLEAIRSAVKKRQLPITNQVYELADEALKSLSNGEGK